MNAPAFICSGDATPSNEDRELTSRLRNAGELIGIAMLDHIVLGENSISRAAETPRQKERS